MRKGQEKENVQNRKDEGNSQVHTPIINGERGYKSETSPGRNPLTEVDSAAGDAGDATQNTNLQEAGTGGGTSGYWGDHGNGANAGGSVGEFGVFGGFDEGA